METEAERFMRLAKALFDEQRSDPVIAAFEMELFGRFIDHERYPPQD